MVWPLRLNWTSWRKGKYLRLPPVRPSSSLILMNKSSNGLYIIFQHQQNIAGAVSRWIFVNILPIRLPVFLLTLSNSNTHVSVKILFPFHLLFSLYNKSLLISKPRWGVMQGQGNFSVSEKPRSILGPHPFPSSRCTSFLGFFSGGKMTRAWSRPLISIYNHSFIHSFIHWHVQNATIPCRSQERLPFFPVMYSFPSPNSPN